MSIPSPEKSILGWFCASQAGAFVGVLLCVRLYAAVAAAAGSTTNNNSNSLGWR
jgi:hypothetical protein